jgi:hypothetical protein
VRSDIRVAFWVACGPVSYDYKHHFDIIHARGSLFTDIELCEATATGESGVRSLAYRPIVRAAGTKKKGMAIVYKHVQQTPWFPGS